MPTKEERAAEAKKHNGMVRGLFASETAESIGSATIYEDGDGRDLELPKPRFEATGVSVAWSSAPAVLQHAKGRACALDPASFRTPGGNYLGGGWSPEEQLCAESNLFPILEGLKAAYYDGNRQATHGGLFSDRCAYLTDVVFTTGGVMRKRDVLVCAPPNRRFALENHRSEAECDMDLANRVKSLMNIAASREVDTLVLCAFGCGFFDNDAAVVAGLFKEWLDAHPGQFETVVFAIPGGPSLDVFREVFPADEPAAAQPVPDEGEGDGPQDDEDFAVDVEPTEDGRWVFD